MALGLSPRLIKLPASWATVSALITVAGRHEQYYYMEFLFQYGTLLLVSTAANQMPCEQPIARLCTQFRDISTFDDLARLDAAIAFQQDQQTRIAELVNGAKDHNRGTWYSYNTYYNGCKKQYARDSSKGGDRQVSAKEWNLNVIAAAAVTAGVQGYSKETYEYSGGNKLRHFQCQHCKFTIEPCVQYAKHFSNSPCLLTRLVRDHVRHNPRCEYLDFYRDICLLPELFRPECSAPSSLPDYTDRKNMFAQQLIEAGYFGFNKEAQVAERDSAPLAVFSYWTGSYFRCDTWQALVPACTFEPA